MTSRDLNAAFDELDAFGAFFGAFAARETNELARERWRRLSLGYPGTADLLRGLLARERLLLADLPPGRVSAVLDRGLIAIDRDLDGLWSGGLLADGEDAEARRRRDVLLPALFEALGRRQPPQDWPWLADHLRAVGGFGALAQDPVARPLLARFFHAKDSYLRLAMQRIGESAPAARRSLAGRQAAAFRSTQDLAAELAATFGLEPAARLRDDWAGYVASVDGFAVTRGWVLLDPALRQTQLGAAARREAGAVRQAAAEVVAEAPRSAVAAAREAVARPVAPAAGPPAAPAPTATVPLGGLVGQLESTGEAAAELPPPTPAVEPGSSDFRSFAAQIKEIAEQAPVPAPAEPPPAATPAASPGEAATLESKRDALAAASPAAPEPATRAPQIAVVAPPVAPALPPAAPVTERSALFLALAAALLFAALLLVLLWPRRRAGGRVAPEPVLLLLAAPDAAEQPLAAVVEAPSPPAAPRVVTEAAALPRVDLQPGRAARVQGVVPATAAAAAAQRASGAREASRLAAATPTAQRGGEADAAQRGSEADTAAHPIVQALRSGNLPLFELLFGELTGLRAPQLQRIVYGGRGADLAIVCRAVGVDQLLFGSIFMLTDHLRGGTPEEEPERLAEFLSFYDRLEPATARKMLAKWQHDWSGGALREPVDA